MLLASQYLDSASTSLSTVAPAKPTLLTWTGTNTRVGRHCTKASGKDNLRIPARPATGNFFKLPSSAATTTSQDLVLYNKNGTALATVQPASVISGGTSPAWVPFFYYDEDDSALWVMAKDSGGFQLATVNDTTGVVTKIGAVFAASILYSTNDFGVAYTNRKETGNFRFFVNASIWDVPSAGGSATAVDKNYPNGAEKWTYDATQGYPYMVDDESMLILKRFAPFGGVAGQESIMSLCVDTANYTLITHAHARIFGVEPALGANTYTDPNGAFGSPGFVGMKIAGTRCVWFPIVSGATAANIPWCLYERSEIDRVLKEVAAASFGG